MGKKKRKSTNRITIEDYIKAVKKADREIQLSNNSGWISNNRIHKSKKTYNRKTDNKNYLQDE